MIKIVSGVLHEDIDLWRWCHRLLLLLYLKIGKHRMEEKAGHERWTMLQFPHE